MASRGENGMSIAEFEEARRKIAIDMLKQCRTFVEIDLKIVQSLAQISQTIADLISKNPDILVVGADRRAFAEAFEQAGGGLAAGDITGGDPLDIIARVIELINGAIGEEKAFIQKIIESLLDL